MKVGAIQSNYIPWRGYFDFIDDCDLFIFYDDVLYTKKNWRNRNRIKTHSGLIWLTVPVVHKHNALIENTCIDYTKNWIDKHIRSLKFNYQDAPFYDLYSEGFINILNSRPKTISILNVNICGWVMDQLQIKTAIRMSNEFSIEGNKTDRPLKILKHIGATSYLSGPAAKSYTNSEDFRKANIRLEYKVYDYPEYPQLHGSFESNVTILDLLFNCGPESRKYLKSRTPNEVIYD